MNKFLFLLLILFSLTVSAQTTDSTFTQKKHTVGFAGIPLHILFIDGSVRKQSYNLSYKKQGQKLNFRSSINYFNEENYFFDRSTTNEFVITANDSTWQKRTTQDYKRNEIDIRFGLEKNWGNKRSIFLLGLDLVLGYVNSDNQENETYYPFEFGDTLDFSSQESFNIFRSNSNHSEKTYSHMMLGLGPAVGWEYAINKTFGFSVQYRPTIAYRKGKSAKEIKHENFVGGVALENSIITNTELNSSWDDVRFDGEGIDLFLTVNF